VLIYVIVNEAWRPYRIMAHALGGAVAEDRLLYEETDEGFRASVRTAQSGEVIFLITGDHVTSEVRFIQAADPFAAPRLIAPRAPGHEYHADHGGGALYIRTNDTHKNFRIVTARLDAPAPAQWREVIAGSDERYIRGLTAFDDVLVLEERHAGLDQVIIRTPDGAEQAVAFPEASYQARLGDTRGRAPAAIRIEYSSMATPATTYAFDLAARQLTVLKVQKIPSGYDPADYVTERLMAPARDGVLVPISLVYRKDWRKGQGAPLHLYGYGAYGIGMSPSFSAARISLLDRGFAYAIAHIRGGDELGYGWYEAGKREQRQNTFNDFIDAARFLESEGYAAPGGISASGGSAGGQLMGVIVNEAPALWRAVVAHVPFVDALNTMQDATLPLTPPEWPEWGNPLTDKAAFDLIRSYSPYDNVKAQDYPPLMITAGLNDPRVTYWEPAKWTAKLRALKTDHHVLVSKTNMGAGHGGKSGRFDRLTEVAEEFAFVIDAFKH
jgi:oligopeptidase B